MHLRIDYITMICIQFGVLNTIHHAALNNTVKYILLHTLK